jgi:N-sulfoglucosamine sulfohydrolase
MKFPLSRFLACVLLVLVASRGRATAATPATRPPNILFVIFDDWGWRHSGAYGAQWVKTPNFDRVAREGVRFENCFTSNPKCSPCRASILTGRNTWQLEEAVSHFGIFPNKFAVYPDLLEKGGYAVGFTGKGWAPGDFKAGGWTRNPAGPAFNQFQVAAADRTASGISRNDYVRNFEGFLKQRPTDKPFCFWMGIFEPHRVYELNSGTRLGKKLEDIPVPDYLPDLPSVRSDLADYAIEVEWADTMLGKALALLEKSGELDNTVIVVTSDNGIPFPYAKGQIYEDGYHLPLAIRWPGTIKAGRTVTDFVNVSDFAPTFLEIGGQKPHQQMVGKSILPLLRSEKSGWIDRSRDTMVIAKERHDLGRPHDWGYPVRAIRTADFLYVHNYFPDRWPAGNPETDFGNIDGGPTKEVVKTLGGYYYELAMGKRPADQLFRLTDDPWCVRDLATDPAFASEMKKLQERMYAQLRKEEDPRALGHAEIFDTYKYTGERGKAYDTWLKAQEERAKKAAEAKPASASGS